VGKFGGEMTSCHDHQWTFWDKQLWQRPKAVVGKRIYHFLGAKWWSKMTKYGNLQGIDKASHSSQNPGPNCENLIM
jgi:hypothetical protein